MAEKRCSGCTQTKPTSDFHKRKASRDGFAYQCKVCKKAAMADWYVDNREERLAKVNEYNANHREDKAAYTRLYRAANPSYMQDWNTANPDKRLSYTVSRRLITAKAFVEHVDRRSVWGRDEMHCRGCVKFVPFEEMHLDHVIPLSRGGVHAYYNVQTLCAPCNLRKGTKTNAEMGWEVGLRGHLHQ